jgi:uncharacterized membrane protein YesL
MRVLRIIGKAAVAFYDELFFYFLTGLIHMVCWLLIIPGPFALTGVYVVGQRAVRGLGVKWALVWEGVKEYGLRSLMLFLITIVGYAIVVSNLIFYNSPNLSPFPASVATWTTPLFVIIGLLWTSIAFYAQSFLMELKKPTVLLALKNSLFLTILRPFTTLGLLLTAVVAVVLSLLLPVLIIVSPGFISVLSLTAVRTLIPELAEQAEALEENTKDEKDGETNNEEERPVEGR